MTWTEADHTRLATLFEGVAPPPEPVPCTPRTPYAGYTPEVAEVPNGDAGHDYAPGRPCTCGATIGNLIAPAQPACPARASRIDTGKRYLHVAPKYNPPQWAADYYDRAFAEACRVATALGVPAAYRPHEAYCALRVLEYPSAACLPNVEIDGNGDDWCQLCGKVDSVISDDRVCPALAAGAGTAEHTDPSLFTIPLWRSHPEDLELKTRRPGGNVNLDQMVAARRRVPDLHMGELGEIIGLGPATPHRVPAIVFFAIPDHAAALPLHKHWKAPCHYCGVPSPAEDGECGRSPVMRTVGEWLGPAIDKRRVRK
jgi:hypothetical protein